MAVTPDMALEAAHRLRHSRGYAALSEEERGALDRDLGRIEAVLYGQPAAPATLRPAAMAVDPYAVDPYVVGLETPVSLRPGLPPPRPPGPRPPPPPDGRPGGPLPPGPPPARPGTEVIGERARAALDAVDFPAFVAGLVQGTFQAIVDATAQQVRQYADLVASLASSVSDFARDNVSPNQARDWLAGRHPADIRILLPATGEAGEPRLQPRSRTPGSPAWLAEYGLAEQELTVDLLEGPLLDASRQRLAEERMQTLATMVLMGINRIVVEDGQIKARMQFHAKAREVVNAEVSAGGSGTQGSIAQRGTNSGVAAQTMVSTVSVNAQADIGIKADLMGEVQIRFRSETFDLNQFADTPAIQLINRHARPAGSAAPLAPGPGTAALPAGAPSAGSDGGGQ